MPYVVTRSDEYLEHHGIQGQKWGVRKGPPYPLDYDSHTGAEKRFNSKAELSKYDSEVGKYAGQGKVKPKQLYKEREQAYDKIRVDERAREADIDASKRAEIRANLSKFYKSNFDRNRDIRAINEKYDKAKAWSQQVTKEQKERVNQRMLEVYGSNTEEQIKKYQKGKVARGITLGVLGAATIVGGAIVAKKIADKKSGSRAYSTEELKKMGIETFEPIRFEPTRFEPDRIEISRIHIDRI